MEQQYKDYDELLDSDDGNGGNDVDDWAVDEGDHDLLADLLRQQAESMLWAFALGIGGAAVLMMIVMMGVAL